MRAETRLQKDDATFATTHVATFSSAVFIVLSPVRPHGFFEYSINVRKSYITSVECTLREGCRACFACYRSLFSSPFSSFTSRGVNELPRCRKRRRRRSFVLPSSSLSPTFFNLPLEPDPSFPFPVFVYLNFNAESPRCRQTFSPPPSLIPVRVAGKDGWSQTVLVISYSRTNTGLWFEFWKKQGNWMTLKWLTLLLEIFVDHPLFLFLVRTNWSNYC